MFLLWFWRFVDVPEILLRITCNDFLSCFKDLFKLQQQPLEVFCKKVLVKVLQISQENTCVGVFMLKFAKFLRTPIWKNRRERLLLKLENLYPMIPWSLLAGISIHPGQPEQFLTRYYIKWYKYVGIAFFSFDWFNSICFCYEEF